MGMLCLHILQSDGGGVVSGKSDIAGVYQSRQASVAISNIRGIRGSRGGDVAIERRGRHAEAVRDLGNADVGVGQQRLGGLDVVVREFRRTASGATNAPRGSEARLGAFSDEAALEFR
jgi:hypothetical protein